MGPTVYRAYGFPNQPSFGKKRPAIGGNREKRGKRDTKSEFGKLFTLGKSLFDPLGSSSYIFYNRWIRHPNREGGIDTF